MLTFYYDVLLLFGFTERAAAPVEAQNMTKIASRGLDDMALHCCHKIIVDHTLDGAGE